MKTWIDEQTGCKMCEADCVDEWLSDIYNIGYDYDRYRDAKNLMELIDELLEMVCKARNCLWQGKLFGVYGAPVRKDKKEEVEEICRKFSEKYEDMPKKRPTSD